MERLTIRNSDGTVSQPTDLQWADALERLAAYEDTGMEPDHLRELAKGEKMRDGMTESHSEAAILRGCIALMQRLMGRFEDYLDFIDVHPDDEEERFCTEFYMSEIVERLFLWETHHSGGTSQHMKLAALGVEAETVTFEDSRETEAETEVEGKYEKFALHSGRT